MPLNWDDDEEEELTELEYRKRPRRVLVHEEVTDPMGEKPRRRSPYMPTTQPSSPTPAPRTQTGIGFIPAAQRDRFVAFLIDTAIGFYLYSFLGYILNLFFETPTIKVLHQNTGRFSMHIILTLVIFFFYYLLMESVLGATLGKFFCRIRVIEVTGRNASLGNIFIRNFLRVVDYPLAFLIAVIAMESSPLNQRLGDRAGNTVVIKKTRRYFPRVDLQHTPLASTLSRIMAEFIDLLFSLTIVYCFFLFINPQRPLFSYVIFWSIPIVFIFYYTLLEVLTGTTPGKALFRRQVILENGEPPDGTSAFLRNLFRPIDYLLGYPLLVVSKKKQRLGDMAADTLVVVKPCEKRGIFGALLAILLVILFAYLSFSKTDNALRKKSFFEPLKVVKVYIPFLKKPFIAPPTKFGPQKKPKGKNGEPTQKEIPSKDLPKTTSDRLKLAEFYFATGPEPNQIRYDGKFRKGDLIYLFFKIEGFEIGPQKDTSLSEDLKVENPQGKIILSQPQIVKLSKPAEGETKGILFANNIKLPKNAPQGGYRVIITIYDHVAETQYSFARRFEIQ